MSGQVVDANYARASRDLGRTTGYLEALDDMNVLDTFNAVVQAGLGGGEVVSADGSDGYRSSSRGSRSERSGREESSLSSDLDYDSSEEELEFERVDPGVGDGEEEDLEGVEFEVVDSEDSYEEVDLDIDVLYDDADLEAGFLRTADVPYAVRMSGEGYGAVDSFRVVVSDYEIPGLVEDGEVSEGLIAEGWEGLDDVYDEVRVSEMNVRDTGEEALYTGFDPLSLGDAGNYALRIEALDEEGGVLGVSSWERLEVEDYSLRQELDDAREAWGEFHSLLGMEPRSFRESYQEVRGDPWNQKIERMMGRESTVMGGFFDWLTPSSR